MILNQEQISHTSFINMTLLKKILRYLCKVKLSLELMQQMVVYNQLLMVKFMDAEDHLIL